MSVIKGGDLMLFVDGKSIAYATNHTISINADTKETSTKDAGGKWQTSEVGILSWSATSENLYAEPEGGEGHHYEDLFTYMVNRTPITAVFSIEGDSPNLNDGKFDQVPTGGWTYSKTAKALTGKVIITSLELNAQNGENASFTANFTGTGPLVSKTMTE